MKIIEVILIVALIFAAIYEFEIFNPTKWLTSALLTMMALTLIIKNESVKSKIRQISLVLIVLLFLKLIFIG